MCKRAKSQWVHGQVKSSEERPQLLRRTSPPLPGATTTTVQDSSCDDGAEEFRWSACVVMVIFAGPAMSCPELTLVGVSRVRSQRRLL